jgi:hypothetical protein
MEKAIAGARCYECGRTFKKGDYWSYYYHGDQDDRVCISCANKLKNTDTAYAGMNVLKTNLWGSDEKTIKAVERKLKKIAGF